MATPSQVDVQPGVLYSDAEMEAIMNTALAAPPAIEKPKAPQRKRAPAKVKATMAMVAGIAAVTDDRQYGLPQEGIITSWVEGHDLRNPEFVVDYQEYRTANLIIGPPIIQLVDGKNMARMHIRYMHAKGPGPLILGALYNDLKLVSDGIISAESTYGTGHKYMNMKFAATDPVNKKQQELYQGCVTRIHDDVATYIAGRGTPRLLATDVGYRTLCNTLASAQADPEKADRAFPQLIRKNLDGDGAAAGVKYMSIRLRAGGPQDAQVFTNFFLASSGLPVRPDLIPNPASMETLTLFSDVFFTSGAPEKRRAFLQTRLVQASVEAWTVPTAAIITTPNLCGKRKRPGAVVQETAKAIAVSVITGDNVNGAASGYTVPVPPKPKAAPKPRKRAPPKPKTAPPPPAPAKKASRNRYLDLEADEDDDEEEEEEEDADEDDNSDIIEYEEDDE